MDEEENGIKVVKLPLMGAPLSVGKLIRHNWTRNEFNAWRLGKLRKKEWENSHSKLSKKRRKRKRKMEASSGKKGK